MSSDVRCRPSLAAKGVATTATQQATNRRQGGSDCEDTSAAVIDQAVTARHICLSIEIPDTLVCRHGYGVNKALITGPIDGDRLAMSAGIGRAMTALDSTKVWK